MQKESALEAHTISSARGPNGLRRLSLAMLATGKMAENFKGTEEGQGATRPGQVLAAFKAAAPYLGLNPRVVHAVDWLFTFTQPQDWYEGSRPVVWPSAALQREALAIGVTQAKAINRQLVELGLVTMKDSPNGKRYGRRKGPKGPIIEAYGFDLSPLFTRMAEFQAVAEQGRELRERMRHLRRRATIARNGLLQILDTAAEQGLSDPTWQALEGEGRALARSLRTVERVEEMEMGVVSLERRQREARERLEMQIAPSVTSVPEAVDSDPKGPENRPHILTTNQCLNLKDTVMAPEGSSLMADRAFSDPDTAQQPNGQRNAKAVRLARIDTGTIMRLTTDELVRRAPRLKPYLATSSPGWPEIIDAAEWLRHDLGVSKTLWGDACLAMGREEAAIALAIVSAKPADHFRSNPGGYFYGMVTKAKAGELNLARTVWGLRSAGGLKGEG